MTRMTDYWLAQTVIFLLVCTFPLISLAVVEPSKIFIYTHDWVIYVTICLACWHFVARTVIKKIAHRHIVSFFVAVTLTTLTAIAPIYLLTMIWETDNQAQSSLFGSLFGLNIVLNIIWVVGYRLALSARERGRLESQYQELNLKLLTQQIQPQLLYQSLDKIEMLMDTDRDAACDSITDLAELLRYKLKASKQNEVYLKDELNAVHFMQHLADAGDIVIEEMDEHLIADIEVPPLCIYHLCYLLNRKIDQPLYIRFTRDQQQWSLSISGVYSYPRVIKRKLSKQYPQFFNQHALLDYSDNTVVLTVR